MDGEVTPEDVAELYDEDGVAIVDIRAPSAFARGHIPGSHSIPFQEVPTAAETVADADRIVTVCPHGEASVRAARLLAAAEAIDDDTRIESMAGGITSWEGALETADADETADAPF
ncbi:MAG: rhodanese-like domain-containing protein [Halobacteriaceae archaeon]